MDTTDFAEITSECDSLTRLMLNPVESCLEISLSDFAPKFGETFQAIMESRPRLGVSIEQNFRQGDDFGPVLRVWIQTSTCALPELGLLHAAAVDEFASST